jgi:hypothetical protein
MARISSLVAIDASKLNGLLRQIAEQYYGVPPDGKHILKAELVARAKPATRRTLARLLAARESTVATQTLKGLENLIRKTAPGRREQDRLMDRLLECLAERKTLKIDKHGNRQMVADYDDDNEQVRSELKRLAVLTDAAGASIEQVVTRTREEFALAFARLDVMRDSVGPRRFRLAEFRVVAPFLRSSRTGLGDLDINELSKPKRERMIKAGITIQLTLLDREPDNTRILRARAIWLAGFAQRMEAQVALSIVPHDEGPSWPGDPGGMAEVAEQARKRDEQSSVEPSGVKPPGLPPVRSGAPGNHSWYVVKDYDGEIVLDPDSNPSLAPERRRKTRRHDDPRRRRDDPADSPASA